MSEGATLEQAAKELEETVSQLRKAVAAGAPHWRVGNNPRGALRFDCGKLRPWLAKWRTAKRSRGRPPELDRLLDADLAGSPSAAGAGGSGRQAWESAFSDEDREALRLALGLSEEMAERLLSLPPSVIKHVTADAKARKEKAEADRKELEVREKRRELAPIDELRRHWGAQIEIVHAAFRVAPAAWAKELAGASYEVAYEFLERELHSLLEQFAQEIPA